MISVDRIVVNSDGQACPPDLAKDIFQLEPEVAFKREDGWTLGAPAEYELVAFTLWKGDWTHFSRDMENWISIDEYFN